MRHRYECPLRWADLDTLGHVNNVVYVDYLQEARVDLLRTLLPDSRDDLAEGVVVVRHEVTYLSPLEFRFRPVSIECWVTEIRAASFTLAYEVFHEEAEGRRVYLRATTVLTPFVFADERPRRLRPEEREALAPYLEADDVTRTAPLVTVGPEDATHTYRLHVRFSDVDVYRHVNNVRYFEYLQESRIRFLAEALRPAGLVPPSVVVAQTDVDYRRPILLRREPYEVRSRVERLGTRSFTIVSEIGDPGAAEPVYARSRVVIVFFDLEAGRSTDPDPVVREAVAAYLAR